MSSSFFKQRSRIGWTLLLSLFALFLLLPPVLSVPSSPRFGKVILISFDGVNPNWIVELMGSGHLPNLDSMAKRGALNSLFIVDHDASTNPGLSTIETGYGPNVHTIYANIFAATTKWSIPKGLTIGERIKSHYGPGWLVAVGIPWATAPLPANVTTNVDPIYWELMKSTDYWLAAENLTWRPTDPDFESYAFTPKGLIKGTYLAQRILDEFIRPNVDRNFYVRIHMTEPDTVGHGVGVDKTVDPSSDYAWSLQQCDLAVGILVTGLEELGILEETLVLVTTDHGFLGGGHSGGPKPNQIEEIYTCFLILSHREVASPTGVGIQDDIAPTILSVAGVPLSAVSPAFEETSRAIPLFTATEEVRETSPPQVVGTSFPQQIPEGSRLNATITLSDPSGISWVDVYYRVGLNTLKARVTLTQGTTGSFDIQTVRIWNVNATQIYIEFFDNSTLKNNGRYPESGFITVGVNPVEQPPPSVDYLQYIYIAIPIVVILAVASYLIRRRVR